MLTYPTFPAGTAIKDRPEATPEQHAERIGIFRTVLANMAFNELTWTGRNGEQELLIDMQTANAVCLVYDALSPNARDIFVKMEPDEMGRFAWKYVK